MHKDIHVLGLTPLSSNFKELRYSGIIEKQNNFSLSVAFLILQTFLIKQPGRCPFVIQLLTNLYQQPVVNFQLITLFFDTVPSTYHNLI